MNQKNKLTIKIYTTKTCGYCFLAKNLLERNNYTYKEIDVSGMEDIRQKNDKTFQWFKNCTTNFY